MSRFTLIASALALTACATITPPPNQESTRIVVEDVTADQVVAAFIDEGITVASNEGGVVVSTTEQVPEYPAVTATYRANVSNGRATLTGTIYNGQAGAMAAERPLHSEMGGDFGELWLRLERIAEALEAP